MGGVPEPSAGVVVKLASIAAHVKEALSPGGNTADLVSAESLLGDPELVAYMEKLDELALLPLPRVPRAG